MLRRISIIVLLFFSLALHAQEKKPRNLPGFDFKRLHWGFTVGLNSMDFAIDRNFEAENFLYADVNGFQPAGFQVNIVSDLRLAEYWNLRFLPGINLGSRDFIYFDPDTWEQHSIDGNAKRMTIGSSFLDFPLLVKYRSERVNNLRPYVIGGLSYRIDMSARSDFDEEEFDRILLKKSDFYLELGFGLDSYLQYFKFAPEMKICIGLRNVLNPKPFSKEPYYAESINSLQSILVMFNLHFE